MSFTTHAYMVKEIPDPFYSKYMTIADGDVLSAAGRDFEHLLRTLSNLQKKSVTMTIRFVFDPKADAADNQSRLTIYLLATANTENNCECSRILLERGPLNRFYSLRKIDQIPNSLWDMEAACQIIRRENIIKPLYGREYNINIPDFYYTVSSLKPNTGNDFMDLDRILSDISEKIVIDIRVEPTDISNELYAHSRYLSCLQSINRRWDVDDNYDLDVQDFFVNENSYAHTLSQQSLRPLRYSDPLADDVLHIQQRFHEDLQLPHLLFQIIIFAQSPSVSQLIGSVIADSSFEEGSYRLLLNKGMEESFNQMLNSSQELQPYIPSHKHYLFAIKDLNLYSEFQRLSSVATVDELLGVFRLPVATVASPQCIRKNTDPPLESINNAIYWGRDLEGSSTPIQMDTQKCCKHIFVSGVPGSGKTTCMYNLMLQLHQQNIPFIIFEPAKTEYRTLKTLKDASNKNAQSLAKALEVYTLGIEDVSPLRFNPLWIPPGISKNEHIDNLLACFLASMPVAEGPLPALLGEALERIYEENPDSDDPPVMADLIGSVRQVLSEKGYSEETNSDVRAALEVRLGMLIRRAVGKVFQSPQNSPSIEHIMKSSSVLEFDRLYPTQACLIILFYLTSIREHLKSIQKDSKIPRFVIIIEEAHNIVGRSGHAGAPSDAADPKSFAAEYICRMLAELRSLGISIVIVDQLPSAIAPEVIKNTSTKVAFRQVSMEDREDLGASMLFNNLEMEEIARLHTGEAFFYTEGFYRSRKIKTENLHEQLNFNNSVIGEKIKPYIQDDKWFVSVATEMACAELTQLKKIVDSFDQERLQINRSIASLLTKRPLILGEPRTKNTIMMAKKFSKRAQELMNQLKYQFRSLRRTPYKNYLSADSVKNIQEPLVHELRENLVYRINTSIEADVRQALGILEGFIGSCQKLL